MTCGILVGFTYINQYIRILDSQVNVFDGNFFDTGSSIYYKIVGSFNHGIWEASSWESCPTFKTAPQHLRGAHRY
jgi:hypothetical protein